jgi:hypothetical protein
MQLRREHVDEWANRRGHGDHEPTSAVVADRRLLWTNDPESRNLSLDISAGIGPVSDTEDHGDRFARELFGAELKRRPGG